MTETIALIPARGGSKRIPGKNIKNFRGKPIIAYSIDAALRTELFDRVIVSTDSEKIAAVAKQFGAQIPFMRPAQLAGDFSTTAEVIRHALDWCLENTGPVANICCLYATAPFVTPENIHKGYKLLTFRRASSVFTVAAHPSPVFRALKNDDEGYLQMVWPEYELTRSNDLPETYYDAGQFYWLDAGKFRQSTKMYAEDALPLVLPRYLAQDIDTPEDWEMAELMYETLERKGLL
jgi:pseudaminic acid cytidylyltransferase